MNTFTTFGTGPRKVLVLPGLFGARPLEPMLAMADGDACQYVVMDYRGYGASRALPGLCHLREVVIDAIRLLDYLGWTHAHVLGHSMGALAAQMLAVAAPRRIRSIVSLAGLGAQGASRDPAHRRLMSEAAHDLAKRAAVIDNGTGKRYGAAQVRLLAEASWNAMKPEAFAAYAADAAATDIQREVDGSAVPFHAIVGAHDPSASEKAARETSLRWYRDSSLTVLAGAGHYPSIETPLQAIAAIESFLSQAESAAREKEKLAA